MRLDQHDEILMLAPYQLAVMYLAFDAIWPEVAPDYSTSLTSTEAGRIRLANAVLTAYQNGFTEPATLSAYARRRMAMRHGEFQVAQALGLSVPIIVGRYRR